MRGALAGIAAAAMVIGSAGAAEAGCRFSAATALSFEPYNARKPGPTVGTGTIVVTCSTPTTVTITIGPGRSGDALHRAMSAGGSTRLFYNMYSDPSLATIWGDGSSGSAPSLSVPGGFKPARLMIYGAIAPGQSVQSGTYSDDLFLTIEF